MKKQSKEATIGEIFIVCVVGIIWFLLNRVDSWFFAMNTNYLHKVLATNPIAVSVSEGNQEIFDRTIGNTTVVKKLKTFSSTGSIWDQAVRDDLLNANFRTNRLLPKYIVQHVQKAKEDYVGQTGPTYNDYIYYLEKDDDVNLTQVNKWLHDHHILVGTEEYEGFHPQEYLGHMLDHEHDISEASFTNRELQDGVEIGKGPDFDVNNGSRVVIRVWYKYAGRIYCVIGGGDSEDTNRVIMEEVTKPIYGNQYNYYPDVMLGK